MKLLLDTCTFLWIAAGSAQLSKRAAQLFSDPQRSFSKRGPRMGNRGQTFPGLLPLPAPAADYIFSLRERHGIAPLRISEEEALYLPRVPKLHGVPFDRLLVCQAIVNGPWRSSHQIR